MYMLTIIVLVFMGKGKKEQEKFPFIKMETSVTPYALRAAQ